MSLDNVWNWNKIISAAEIISATLNMLEDIRELQCLREIMFR